MCHKDNKGWILIVYYKIDPQWCMKWNIKTRLIFKSWTNSLSWHQKISKLASCFLVPSQKHTFLTFFTTRGQTRKSLILVIDFFHLRSITRSKNALKRCEFSILKCFFFTNKNLQTLPTSNDIRIKLVESLGLNNSRSSCMYEWYCKNLTLALP